MSNQKGKVAVILDNEIYCRNYLTTNALSKFAENNKVTIFAPYALEKLVKEHSIKEGFDFVGYEYSAALNKLARLVNELSLFGNIDLSSDFRFRVKRKYNTSPHLRDGRLNANKLWVRLKSFVLKSIYTILAQKLSRRIINNYARKKLQHSSPIQKCLLLGDYDIVICVSSAADTPSIDIAAYAQMQTRKTTTILVIDNWDNLSSKYVMAFHPDHIVCWGEQSRQHGISIHNIQHTRITSIGTARFEGYFDRDLIENTKVTFSMPKSYVLFCGAQTYFDETKPLKLVDEYLKKHHPGTVLIYRPHPWREQLGLKLEVPEGIMIDPSLSVQPETNSSILLPSTRFYHYVITNAKLVIGGATSMIAEVALMRKPYLLLAHNDGNPIQSPMERFTKSLHQALTPALNNVQICFDTDTLGEDIENLISRSVGKTDHVLDQIISPKTSQYSRHLFEVSWKAHTKRLKQNALQKA